MDSNTRRNEHFAQKLHIKLDKSNKMEYPFRNFAESGVSSKRITYGYESKFQ
jgi:hypothetical protein